MVHTLPIGSRCRWFRQADTSSTPIAAIVTASNGTGLLSLWCIPPGAYAGEVHTGVRHKSHPDCKDRPAWVRANGCWDYVEGEEPAPPAEPVAAVVDDEVVSTEAAEQKLLELAAAHGRDPNKLAKLMTAATGARWTWQKVNGVLQRQTA